MTNQYVRHAEDQITFAFYTVRKFSISENGMAHLLESNVNVRGVLNLIYNKYQVGVLELVKRMIKI